MKIIHFQVSAVRIVKEQLQNSSVLSATGAHFLTVECVDVMRREDMNSNANRALGSASAG